jgi:hypothetical protein
VDTAMSLLDGQLGKTSLIDALVDRLPNINRLFRIAVAVFALSILQTPIVIYFCFAYFTATASPLWLDVITGLNILSFLVGGGATLALGLAKLMARREG